MAGGRDSSEAARDPRGFAVKFYTEDGNWDLVGNNLGVFFIRDAIKFPDFIHSQKPDPVTFRQEPNRQLDFISQSPEALHMAMLLYSPRGIPAGYRFMQGFGVNTYKWVNAEGDTVLVKYHWIPKQGVSHGPQPTPLPCRRDDLGPHSKDLFEAIERGDHPEWELRVQIISDDEHPELDFDPLDDTKVWPENDFEPRPVGPHGAQPQRRERVRGERADRVRHRRAGGRAGLLRRQDARRAHVLLQRHAALPRRPELPPAAGEQPQGAGRDQPARQPDGLQRGRPGREPARELRAVDHRRAVRGA